ncbi:MAG: Sec-independent protein translocase protein TatB [Acetobacteraceae bacterium]|nr:Sec-independent protein translocase protein TatB [Acetobacteraceae bacterium]
MLDLAWSEIALIAVVALVVIGPKDLPGAIRGIADGIKKARKGLAAMQQQADELVREAKLDDVRNQIAEVKGAINEIRSFDLKGEIERAVDKDGTLKDTFSDPAFTNPVSSTPAWTPPPTAKDTPDAPAFIPPQTMAPYKPPPEPPRPEAPAAPAFVPPSTSAPSFVPVAEPPPPVASAPPLAAPAAHVVTPPLNSPAPPANSSAAEPAATRTA